MSKMNPQRKYNAWNTCSRHAAQNKSEKIKVEGPGVFLKKILQAKKRNGIK